MKTTAYVLVKKGNPSRAFEKREVTIPEPNADQVLIEVEGFGLNYADVMARLGLYGEAPSMPSVIGYEVVGTITSVGTNVDRSWQGKRVVAFTRFGGYARKVITQSDAVAEIGNMPIGEALSLATQGVTAYYMSELVAPIRKNDRVLIHAAAGGVGTLLIQLAKRKGAIVYAKAGGQEKLRTCLELGADYAVDYRSKDYAQQLKELLQGNRLDVSYNPVGGSTFKKDMALLGSGSRCVLFGGSELAAGKWGILSKLNFVRKMGFFTPIVLMMKSKSIIGVNMLKIADSKPEILKECLNGIVALAKSGAVLPQVGGVFQADALGDAHALLESGKSTGKIAIVW